MEGSSVPGHPRVAIAYSGERPETFIQAHIDHLKEVVLVLRDGMLPRIANDRQLIATTTQGKIKDGTLGMLQGRTLQQVHVHRLARELRRNRVQVVLAEFGYTAMELIPACRMAGVPLVVQFLGIDAHGRKYLQQYDNYQELFAFAKGVVAVSTKMKDHLIALGAPPEKVTYNCCGVDVDRFDGAMPALAPPHFVGVGRFIEKKAPHLTITAFLKVLQKHPEARLTLVGDGPLWEACSQLVKAHRAEETIDLCGKRSPSEIIELMRRSRAFVQHSVSTMNGDSEGTPVAIQEAMATGLPVIATNHAGIADTVVHQQNGLLCEPFDVDTMAAYMITLLDDPARAGAMGRDAAEHARKSFPMADRIRTLQDVLQKAIT
jgi:colanic acid/amylovoran biosynthesis glycosyltransferase